MFLCRTDLAFQIANDYKFLIHEHDSEGMTAVQLLACKPEAFQRREPGIFRKVINYGNKFDSNITFISSIQIKH